MATGKMVIALMTISALNLLVKQLTMCAGIEKMFKTDNVNQFCLRASSLSGNMLLSLHIAFNGAALSAPGLAKLPLRVRIQVIPGLVGFGTKRFLPPTGRGLRGHPYKILRGKRHRRKR